MEVQQQVDLAPYNTFGVSAKAAHFAYITSAEDLRSGLDYSQQLDLPILVLGKGSNLLFTKDFSGLVLQMDWRGIDWFDALDRVTVACGEDWHNFLIQCMNKGLHGIENLALIPGSVGAAPIQNIGAYGVELSDVVYEVSAMDIRTGEIIKFDYEHCKFSYRNSFFKHKEGKNFIVTSVTLQLSSAWQPNIAYPSLKKALTSTEPSPLQVFDAVCKIRGSKLPDPGKLGNAGSFFKNPVISREKLTSLQFDFPKIPVFDSDINEFVKVPAAWLLEKAGWKGKTRGKAAVSTNHALVLVNLGGASGQDIQLLALEISSSVLEQFGIALEPEVQLI